MNTLQIAKPIYLIVLTCCTFFFHQGCLRKEFLEETKLNYGEESFVRMGSLMYYRDFFKAYVSKSEQDTVYLEQNFTRDYTYFGYINGILRIKEQYFYPQHDGVYRTSGDHQIFEFQITPPDTIAIRENRFLVLKADNQGIRFIPLP